MGVKNEKEKLCYVVVYGEKMNWRYVGSPFVQVAYKNPLGWIMWRVTVKIALFCGKVPWICGVEKMGE
jgi:hypothetical protein